MDLSQPYGDWNKEEAEGEGTCTCFPTCRKQSTGPPLVLCVVWAPQRVGEGIGQGPIRPFSALFDVCSAGWMCQLMSNQWALLRVAHGVVTTLMRQSQPPLNRNEMIWTTFGFGCHITSAAEMF